METTMTEMARRAVACKHWKWMPGMLAEGNYRVVTVTQSGYPNGCTADYDGASCWELSADSLPNLTDPATIGCLLELVFTSYTGSMIPASSNPKWFRDPGFLVSALEAAP